MKYLVTKTELHSILEDGAYMSKDNRTAVVDLIFPKYSDNEVEIEDVETRINNLVHAFKTIEKRFDIIKDVVIRLEQNQAEEQRMKQEDEQDG